MAQVKESIKIGDTKKEVGIRSFNLSQTYNQHHQFELVAIVPEGEQLTISKLESMLGESAELKVTAIEDSEQELDFNGFIDELVPVWTQQGQILRILGFSPGVLMDCTPRFRTFYEETLGSIVDKVFNEYQSKFISSPQKGNLSDKVFYSVQSQETDYQYLCRLADQYGKSFFYDGQEFHFGDLNKANTTSTTFKYGVKTQKGEQLLKQAELSLNTTPLKFKLNANQLKTSEPLEEPSPEVSSSSPLVDTAITKSGLYPSGNIHLSHLVRKNGLKPVSDRMISAQAHNLLRLKGGSSDPRLTVGSKIKLTANKEELLNGTEYLIISINHSVSNDNSYRNSFTAVPADFPFAPRMHSGRQPMSGPKMAVVEETNDTDHFGRVRVKFPGDEEETLSPWLRVLVPYTGNGGMFFLPEKGDKVVVFFDDFKAEKAPFVLGSFFHGEATAEKWKHEENKKKGIQTEKISIMLNDKDGTLKIEADKIEFKARKKIMMEGGDEMKLNGGQQLTQEASRIDLNP